MSDNKDSGRISCWMRYKYQIMADIYDEEGNRYYSISFPDAYGIK